MFWERHFLGEDVEEGFFVSNFRHKNFRVVAVLTFRKSLQRSRHQTIAPKIVAGVNLMCW